MKINDKTNAKTKSIRPKISEDEKVTLGDEQIDQVDSITYLSSIICKHDGCSENVTAFRVIFHRRKKFGEIGM